MDDENLPPSRQREILHQRKVAKPLMEKRRRERINTSLDQLKSLLMEFTRNEEEEEENSYRSKLEKADILEKTVSYLRLLKRQKMSGAISTSADPEASIHSKYVAGFRECAEEVAKYLGKAEGLAPETRNTLLQHLNGRLQQSATEVPQKRIYLRTTSAQPYANPFQAQTPLVSVGTLNNGSLVSFPIQLLPAKLATGETVYVLANTTSPGGVVAADAGVVLEAPDKRLHITGNPENTKIDLKMRNGGTSYEAISPAMSPVRLSGCDNQRAVSPVRFSGCDYQNKREILQPLCRPSSSTLPTSIYSSSPNPTVFTNSKLQMPSYSHANCDLARNTHNTTTTNLVFNNNKNNCHNNNHPPSTTAEPELRFLSNINSFIADGTSSDSERAASGQSPRSPSNAVPSYESIGDQAPVWRPW